MQRKKIKSIDKRHLWHPYTDIDAFERSDFPVVKRAAGVYFYDFNGKKYLDAIASWWCVNFGHSNPALTGAISRQAKKFQNTILGGMSHENAAMLAAGLVKITPKGLSRVFFAGDGASAVEASLRIALQYWENKGEKHRKKFICLKDGYHGDTLGAVGVGYVEAFHKGLKGAISANYRAESPHCARCRFGRHPDSCGTECFSSMEKIIKKRRRVSAAVIVEPLCQGSAGMRIYPAGYLKKLRKLCSRYGLLLIADEIAVGFGRTGAMFACEKAGISPDIMTVGKGLTGGYLPMSAAIVTDEIYNSFRNGRTFYYGHTFSGNPITAAAALAALRLYRKENIIRRIKPLAAIMKKEIACISELLGDSFHNSLGMIAMVEISERQGGAVRAKQIAKKAMDLGLFIRPLGPVIYLWPPLIISKAEVEEMFVLLKRAVLETV
jgi:adenosylmethionine---8-amino-7-oxononanoate aminotransferase